MFHYSWYILLVMFNYSWYILQVMFNYSWYILLVMFHYSWYTLLVMFQFSWCILLVMFQFPWCILQVYTPTQVCTSLTQNPGTQGRLKVWKSQELCLKKLTFCIIYFRHASCHRHGLCCNCQLLPMPLVVTGILNVPLKLHIFITKYYENRHRICLPLCCHARTNCVLGDIT